MAEARPSKDWVTGSSNHPKQAPESEPKERKTALEGLRRYTSPASRKRVLHCRPARCHSLEVLKISSKAASLATETRELRSKVGQVALCGTKSATTTCFYHELKNNFFRKKNRKNIFFRLLEMSEKSRDGPGLPRALVSYAVERTWLLIATREVSAGGWSWEELRTKTRVQTDR